MRRTRLSPSRRGFTLIEIVLVFTAVAIVLGLCAGLLHVLLRLDRAGRAHLVETTTVGRLARQFRQDVHAATRARPDAGDDGDGPSSNLELALPEGRVVTYRAGVQVVVRTQNHGDAVERRESYTLPSCHEPRFLVREDAGRVWVGLRLPRGAGLDAGPKGLRHDLHIEALAGRDHRLSPTQSKEVSP